MQRRPRGRPFNPRKRKGDFQSPQKESGPLLLEDPPLPEKQDVIVDKSKVVAHLHRISSESQGEAKQGCARILLADSEAAYLEEQLQQIQKDFELSSITISEADPYSIDRIVALYGENKQAAAAAVYIGFLLVSEYNNTLKIEQFTLKSQNYKIDLLVETDDYELDPFVEKHNLRDFDHAEYDENLIVSLATIKGDLAYLFKTILLVYENFQFQKIQSDQDINITPVINVHDGDYLRHKDEEALKTVKDQLLKYVYTQKFREQ